MAKLTTGFQIVRVVMMNHDQDSIMLSVTGASLSTEACCKPAPNKIAKNIDAFAAFTFRFGVVASSFVRKANISFLAEGVRVVIR
jgi:hypothetical protein